MENIIVFGVGKYFLYKKDALEKKYRIILFLDNSVKFDEEKYYKDSNIKIVNPTHVMEIANDNTKIFLMSVNFYDMWRQMIELGASPHRLIVPYNVKPYYRYENTLAGLQLKLDHNHSNQLMICIDDKSYVIENKHKWEAALQAIYREKFSFINAISHMNVMPISVQCGWERGLPIDRVYIEKVLENYKGYICGDVLEVADNFYTLKYGSNVNKSYVMHANANEDGKLNINLETGLGIKEKLCDTFILTQTLMYIYDLKQAIHNIFCLLKPGGTCLITCSGISQNAPSCQDEYGCYFNFCVDGMRKLLEEESLCSNIIGIGSYGNVKTAAAHVAGLCKEDLAAIDFDYNDSYYPVIVYGVAQR